jgi:Protein of unknown function (DUF1553)/Protein of unknown function (DUF1549)/Planctomycete cytochrome C
MHSVMTITIPRPRSLAVLALVFVVAGAVAAHKFRRRRHHHHHDWHTHRHHHRDPVASIPAPSAEMPVIVAPKPESPWVGYTRDVKPILEKHCYSCHGPARSGAGLRLDTAASIRKGSDHGPVVIPGKASASPLLAAVSSINGEMPRMPAKGDPLTDAEIERLRAWIDDGAVSPDNEDPAPLKVDHWAFRPPVRPVLPTAPDARVLNPVDALLSVGYATKGLTPSPPAGKEQLLRRVTIDLIGLPPTREELQAFLADTSDDAYEKVVDRLLASSRYGERWGRHWMDLWRYAEGSGRKAKNEIWWSHPLVWRWRDWIIRSLNSDKGYDHMVMEMLAGDEIAPSDPETLAATGFLVRNCFWRERNAWLNGTIEHTGKAFLGLTIACARCHNHKFDPISQREYYNFRAIFEPHELRTDPIPGAPKGTEVVHVFDVGTPRPTYLYIRGNDKNPDKEVQIAPGVPTVLGGSLHIEAVPIPRKPEDAGREDHPPVSTGRRLALARWIVDPKNPLTARVAVNHIWARHFDRPLVENVFDFGLRTKAPVQQPLLDWLAIEFVEHGWSMKWLHRTLVTSAAYRMSTTAPDAAHDGLSADPDNRYFARRSPKRVEAEVVRDALLWLGGNLDPAMGGPPLDCEAEPGSARRSVYHTYSRELRMPFLVAFDAANVEECYRRQESVVPQQALALENSALAWQQARLIARRLDPRKGTSDEEFMTAAFEHVLGRSPKEAELRACAAFLDRQRGLLSDKSHLQPFPSSPTPRVQAATDPAAAAREHLVHALLNHNDFLTVR